MCTCLNGRVMWSCAKRLFPIEKKRGKKGEKLGGKKEGEIKIIVYKFIYIKDWDRRKKRKKREGTRQSEEDGSLSIFFFWEEKK